MFHVRSMLLVGAGLSVACTPAAQTEPGPDPLDPNVAPVTEGGWARPGPAATWQWQRSSPIDLQFDASLYVVDLFGATFTEVSSIRAQDRWAFCEASAATRGDTPDAGTLDAAAVGNAVADAPDERWLDVRDAGVQEWMRTRLDQAVQWGCDGIALSRVDGLDADTGFPITRDEQLAYLRHIYNEAHERDLAVAFMAGPDWVEDLVDYADVAIVERCHELGNCDAYAAFQTAGKPLLDAELSAEFAADPVPVCVNALMQRVRTLLLDEPRDNRVRVSCDEDLPSMGPLATVETFGSTVATDAAAVRSLVGGDLSIVDATLTLDQRRALQLTGQAIVALPVGGVERADRFYDAGRWVSGEDLQAAHSDWFLGEHASLDGWIADVANLDWQTFVMAQASHRLDQGYDGLLLTLVDTAESHPTTRDGMVALIGRLDGTHPDATLVQDAAWAVIDDTAEAVDGVRMKGFGSRFDADAGRYVASDPSAVGAEEILRQALTYRLQGGVVLAQDFGEPGLRDAELLCATQSRALEHRFVPSYTDVDFQAGAAEYPEACPWPDEPQLRLSVTPAVVHLRPGSTVPVEVAHAGVNGFDTTINLSVMSPAAAVSVGVPSSRVEPKVPVTLSVSGSFGLVEGEWAIPLSGSVFGEERDYSLRTVGHVQSLWVADAARDEVAVFDDPADSLVPEVPARRTDQAVVQAFDVAVDGGYASWVVEYEGDPAAKQPAGRVLVYEPFDMEAPRTDVNEGLNYPTGIAIDGAGRGWVANSALDETGTRWGRPDISVIVEKDTFAQVAFRYDETTYGHPSRLAFAPSGRLFVSTTAGLVLGFDLPTPSVEAEPVVVITGDVDAFDTVRGITFDADGDLWLAAAVKGAGHLLEIPSGLWETDPAISLADVSARITDGVVEPWGLTFDASQRLWVVDAAGSPDGTGRVLRFDNATDGATADQVIPQASAGLRAIAAGQP